MKILWVPDMVVVPQLTGQRGAGAYKPFSCQEWLDDVLSCLPCFLLASEGPLLEAPPQPLEDQGGEEKCSPFEGNRWHFPGLFLPEGPLFWMVHNSSR